MAGGKAGKLLGPQLTYSGDPNRDLANAIVFDAAREYRALRRRLYAQHLSYQQEYYLRREMGNIEAFFTEWLLGDILTRGLGPVILEGLRNERL